MSEGAENQTASAELASPRRSLPVVLLGIAAAGLAFGAIYDLFYFGHLSPYQFWTYLAVFSFGDHVASAIWAVTVFCPLFLVLIMGLRAISPRYALSEQAVKEYEAQILPGTFWHRFLPLIAAGYKIGRWMFLVLGVAAIWLADSGVVSDDAFVFVIGNLGYFFLWTALAFQFALRHYSFLSTHNLHFVYTLLTAGAALAAMFGVIMAQMTLLYQVPTHVVSVLSPGTQLYGIPLRYLDRGILVLDPDNHVELIPWDRVVAVRARVPVQF